MNYLTPAGVAPWFTGTLLTEIATALRAAEALRATAAALTTAAAVEDYDEEEDALVDHAEWYEDRAARLVLSYIRPGAPAALRYEAEDVAARYARRRHRYAPEA